MSYPNWKRIAYKEALDELVELEDDGFKIFRSTDWHWIYKGIDIYPSCRKAYKNGRIVYYKKIRDIL